MIQLYSMLWVSAAFFGVIGVLRGLRREILSLAGIILASFALYQFDSILRGIFLASLPRDQAFFIQVILFGVIVYFAYQNRTYNPPPSQPGSNAPRRNDRWQDAIMGGLLGAFNGYLIWGAVWYFLDINEYPLSPLIIAPDPSSISAASIGSIPLVVLGGAAGGSGEMLTIIVVFLFMAVLFIV